MISRFALNLPSLRPADLPGNEHWRRSRDPSSLASTAHSVLHARRLLVDEGEVRGAVHVYVADDFWNLPFLRPTDPYSLLYRPAPRAPSLRTPLALVAYGPQSDVLFSSVERAPAVPPGLWAGLRPGGSGRWTVLEIDGQPHHAYLFSGPDASYLLAYPRAGWGRRVADLVEGVAAFTVAALLALVTLIVVRTALGRRELSLASIRRAVERRFATRLFVAFTVLAVVPVAVLELVVRKFVADRLLGGVEQAGARARQRREEGGRGLRVLPARRARRRRARHRHGPRLGGEPHPQRPRRLRARPAARLQQARAVLLGPAGAAGLRAPCTAPSCSRDSPRCCAPSASATSRTWSRRCPSASRTDSRACCRSRWRRASARWRRRSRTSTADPAGLARVPRPGRAASPSSVARRISGPISALTAATRRVAEGDLATRVAAASRDELQTLVDVVQPDGGRPRPPAPRPRALATASRPGRTWRARWRTRSRTR